jgi:hypothetical protein
MALSKGGIDRDARIGGALEPPVRQPGAQRSAMVVRCAGLTHPSDERRRWQPGEAPGFADEVRLVRVAMLDGEIRQALGAFSVRHGEHLLEARNPLKRLRRVANRRHATATHLPFGQADERPDIGKPLRVVPQGSDDELSDRIST